MSSCRGVLATCTQVLYLCSLTAMVLASQMTAASDLAQIISPGISPCTIKVIGVGGGGGNTINRMVQVSVPFYYAI